MASCSCSPPATRTIHGFRLVDGDLVPVEGAKRTLSTPDGAQVGFTPDGRALIATERGGDKLSAFAVGMDGMLGEPRTIDSLGATPYGFAISPNGTLVVTEAFRAEKGAAAASSYRVDGDTITPGTASIGNGRSEICWAVISNDGRYAFTTNFADGAVSRYAIGMGGGLTLEDATAGVTEDGRAGLRDEDLSDDGRFLYAIDADQGQIVGVVRRRAGPTLDGRLLGRRADDRRGAGGRLMRLEPFYRVTFTTPESWNVTREGESGAEGQSFLIAEGRAEGRLSARYRAANFPRRRVDGALEPEFRGVARDRRRRDDPVPLGGAGDG